jgi:hypothetical protein
LGNEENHLGNEAGQHNHPLWDLQNEVQGQQEELPVSMVMNISDGSDSSVNMVLDGAAPVQQNLQVFAMVEMFIGPSPPPEMLRHRWLAAVLPTATHVLQFNKLGSSPFIFLKHYVVMLGKDGCLSTYQSYDGENKGCRIFEEEDLLSGQLSVQTPKKRRQRKKMAPLVENLRGGSLGAVSTRRVIDPGMFWTFSQRSRRSQGLSFC